MGSGPGSVSQLKVCGPLWRGVAGQEDIESTDVRRSSCPLVTDRVGVPRLLPEGHAPVRPLRPPTLVPSLPVTAPAIETRVLEIPGVTLVPTPRVVTEVRAVTLRCASLRRDVETGVTLDVAGPSPETGPALLHPRVE